MTLVNNFQMMIFKVIHAHPDVLKLEKSTICPTHHLELEWLFGNHNDQRLLPTHCQAYLLSPTVERQSDYPQTNSSLSHKGPDILNTVNSLGQGCSHCNTDTHTHLDFPTNKL